MHVQVVLQLEKNTIKTN